MIIIFFQDWFTAKEPSNLFTENMPRFHDNFSNEVYTFLLINI